MKLTAAPVLWFSITAPLLVPASNENSLSEAYQNMLLERFSPVVIADGPGQQSPVSAIWFLRKSDLWDNPDRRGQPLLQSPSARALLDWLEANRGVTGKNMHLRLKNGQNGPAADRRSWERTIREDSGAYGRVRPSPTSGSLVWVQFFFLLPWNETAYSFGLGNHEGDWLCIDLTVDISNRENPKLLAAIYHNHGRQIFVPVRDLELQSGDHPVAYLEAGTNEPWPQAGGRGQQGWPRGAIAANRLFGTGNGLESDFKVVREHRGRGPRWLVKSPRSLESAADDETRVIVRYPGTWGGFWKGAAFDVRSPEGPPFQDKMWNRAFGGPGGTGNRGAPLWLGPKGGEGGREYGDRPVSGKVTGVIIWADDFVRAVQLIVNSKPYALHGRPRGRMKRIDFDPGEELIGFRGTHGKVVDSIVVTTNRRTYPKLGGGSDKQYDLRVPEGYEACGIFGQYGDRLDSIGLVVRPRE